MQADELAISGRRTQQQRREATRARLMNATIESLIDCGYYGATTLDIERRAGVSRGARIHHYPTKASLLAAAVDHLYDQVSSSYEHVFGGAEPGTSDAQRARMGLRRLWEMFRGRDYSAVVELTVAARTDDELQACLQAVGLRHRELALQAAARHFALPAEQAFPLIETAHAAMMGLLLRRNVQGDDVVPDLVLKMLEEMIISRLPASSMQPAPSTQIAGANHSSLPVEQA
jgi:AcrR family transcriptional regulator